MVKPDDFSNLTAMSKLLKDYWLMGNKAPGVPEGPMAHSSALDAAELNGNVIMESSLCFGI
jgi:hypothetical protein